MRQRPGRTAPRVADTSTILWGLLLVGGGLMVLLETADLLPTAAWFWALVFALAGVVLLTAFLLRAAAWWAAIPAGGLLGLGAATLLGESAAGGSVDWAGVAFLGLSGTGFCAVYLRTRRRWWAVIPGGACLTLAGTAATEPTDEQLGVAVFLLGLGVTFLLLAVVPTDGRRMRWPLVPGGVLTGVGLLTVLGAGPVLGVLGYAWPVALIGAGVFVLWRGLHRPRPGA